MASPRTRQSIPDLIRELLQRKPFREFSLEMVAGDPVTITKPEQARLEQESGLLYVTGWHKNTTTVLVLSKVVAIQVLDKI